MANEYRTVKRNFRGEFPTSAELALAAERLLCERTETVVLPYIDATTPADGSRFVVLRAPAGRRYVLVDVQFFSDAGATSDGTNYRTLKLGKHTAASATIALLDTRLGASTTSTANLPVAFTIDEQTDYLDETEVLELELEEAGSGMVLGNASLCIRYRIETTGGD